MNIRAVLATSVSALACANAVASAQEFYSNFGLEVGTGQTSDAVSGTYDLNYSGFAATGGVTFPIGQGGFIGGEAGVVLPLSFDNDFSGSEFDLMTRMRIIGGAEVGGVTVFAAAGVTQITGDLFPGAIAENGDGTSLGIGVDVPVFQQSKFRLEIVSDDVDLDSGYRWESTAIRGAAILNF